MSFLECQYYKLHILEYEFDLTVLENYLSTFSISIDLILVYLNNSMLLWIVFAAVGILAAIILVYKYSKTSRYDTLGFSIHCKTCGKKTNVLKCPYCKEEKHDWR